VLLAVDIGNTNITCGLYKNHNWVKIIRIPSTSNFDEQLISLKDYEINNVAISSVVPELTDICYEGINKLFQINGFVINHSNSGIMLDVHNPEEVGSDRICNSVAAINMVGVPAIVGDIGSATNYDVINNASAFIGGAIAPGLETAARNLFNKAALLKETAFKIPKYVIGRDTPTNLQSGIMLGAIDVIDGMFKRIQNEAGWDQSNNIITGGFGELISPYLKTKHQFIPTLTLDGIRIINEKR